MGIRDTPEYKQRCIEGMTWKEVDTEAEAVAFYQWLYDNPAYQFDAFQIRTLQQMIEDGEIDP